MRNHLKTTGLVLPRALQKTARKKILTRILVCISLFALFTAAVLLWGRNYFAQSNPIIKCAIIFWCLALPVWLSGILGVVKDRSYVGTVENVQIKTKVENKQRFKPTREHLVRKNIVYLTIRTEKGKTFTKKAYEESADVPFDPMMYKTGDRVIHVYGSPFIVPLLPLSSASCRCVICAGINGRTSDLCAFCGAPLVRDIEERGPCGGREK